VNKVMMKAIQASAVITIKFSGLNSCQYCVYAGEKKLHGSRKQTVNPTHH
jgi:hypothetical protein